MKDHRHKQRASLNGATRRQLSTLFLGALALGAAAFAGNEAKLDQPTDILHKEHNLISRVAAAAETTAQSIRDESSVDRQRIEKLHDFFTNFADTCHHAKEENELFPILKESGVDPTIVDTLVKQHEEGRVLLSGIEQKLTQNPSGFTVDERNALAEYLSQYALLMERHIALENGYLWPRASERLSSTQKDKLVQAFRRIELEELGEGFHEKYHAMAMELLGN